MYYSRFNLLCIVNSKKLLEIDLSSLVNLLSFYFFEQWVWDKSPSLSIVFGLSGKTQWLSGLYYADFISFYSPTQLCGGGTTKSNSNELPISVPLSKNFFLDLLKYSQIHWLVGTFQSLCLDYDISLVGYQQKTVLILREYDFSQSHISFLQNQRKRLHKLLLRAILR